MTFPFCAFNCGADCLADTLTRHHNTSQNTFRAVTDRVNGNCAIFMENSPANVALQLDIIHTRHYVGCCDLLHILYFVSYAVKCTYPFYMVS